MTSVPDSERLTRLGPYVITRVLGEGAMGIVYDARDAHGQRVALKALHGSLNRNDAARTRFEAEMQILRELVHPNVVRSLGSAFLDGRMVLVLEFLEGRTLRELLRTEGPLPASRASWIGAQVARALTTAHLRLRPIVHRDLKPDNIMVLEDGTVKVMDFGVAKVLRDIDAATMGTRQVGTVRYMAPEQVEGGRISGKTDCYGLGLLLYEMLVGKPPFDGTTMVSILRAHCETPPPPFSPELRQRTPKALEDLVFALLAKRADDRPEASVAESILRGLGSAPVAASPTTVAASTEPGLPLAPTGATLASNTPNTSFEAPLGSTSTETLRATPPASTTVMGIGAAMPPALVRPAPEIARPKRSRGPLVAASIAVVLVVGGVATAIALLASSRDHPQQKSARAAASTPLASPPSGDRAPTAVGASSRAGMMEMLGGERCTGAVCERFDGRAPTDVDVERFVERAVALAREKIPGAPLLHVTVMNALHGDRVDATLPNALVIALFPGAAVRLSGTLLVYQATPATNAPSTPVGAWCPFDRARAAVIRAKFELDGASTLLSADSVSTRWFFTSQKGPSARVEPDCSVDVRP